MCWVGVWSWRNCCAWNIWEGDWWRICANPRLWSYCELGSTRQSNRLLGLQPCRMSSSGTAAARRHATPPSAAERESTTNCFHPSLLPSLPHLPWPSSAIAAQREIISKTDQYEKKSLNETSPNKIVRC